MQHRDIEQGSDAWKEIRLGRVTASRVADIIAKTKSGYSASRANYAAQLVAERLTGTVQESYVNAAMQHGIDTESEARDAYSFRTDATVAEIGFVVHPAITQSGASPDGLIGDDGLLEIKCPQTNTHIETLLGASVPGKYVTQIQWQLACTQRAWCDFVSYDPRMPEEMRLFIQRIARDDVQILGLEGEVRAFLDEVETTVQKIKARYG